MTARSSAEYFTSLKNTTARVPSGVQKYACTCTDSNIRVGRLQEVAADDRDGEPETSGSLAKFFIKELDNNDGLIAHDRMSPFQYTL